MIANYYKEAYNERVEDGRKFEYEAQLFILKEIKKSYNIDFEEVD